MWDNAIFYCRSCGGAQQFCPWELSGFDQWISDSSFTFFRVYVISWVSCFDAQAAGQIVKKNHAHPLWHRILSVEIQRDAVWNKCASDFHHGNKQEFCKKRRAVRGYRNAIRHHQHHKWQRKEWFDHQRHSLPNLWWQHKRQHCKCCYY